jgi:prevent-host-death family protein
VRLGSSNHKGAIAELKIAAAATALGVPVLRPMTEHGRYDLVFELATALLRIQCKWAADKGDVVLIQTSGNYLSPRGYVRSTYQAHEIDAIAAYCGELDTCYLLPIDLVAGQYVVQLRRSPPKNGQRAAINWATDYELAGAVAQLEERRHGMAEVRGSSPLSSTSSTPLLVGSNVFRQRFGWYMQRASRGERFEITRRGRPFARLLPPASP